MNNTAALLLLLIGLTLQIKVHGQERPQQNPVIVYAVDMGDDGDPDLDLVSVDVKMYENALRHGLAHKLVVIPIMNWPVKEHQFDHEGQKYSILLPSLELRKI